MISKQFCFPRNVDIFGDMSKERFLKVIPKKRNFSRKVDNFGQIEILFFQGVKKLILSILIFLDILLKNYFFKEI